MNALKCLVLMPFHERFNPVFKTVQQASSLAVTGQPVDSYWLKDMEAAGRITDDILDGLQRSALCVADLTGNNPNVMWETGYAMALRKPTVLISQSVDALPFDLKVHRVVAYDPTALDALQGRLSEAIRQTLARYDVKGSGAVDVVRQTAATIIAVTGSMNADAMRVQRRVESLLAPYLSDEMIWYTGSYGATDETVLDYLLRHANRSITFAAFATHGHSSDVVALRIENDHRLMIETVEI